MSEHEPQNSNASSLRSSPDCAGPPTLRREAVVVVNERGRLGLLIALCSLAGVAVGFGLSNINMAAGIHGNHCGASGMTPVQAVSCAQSQPPPWLGVRIQNRGSGGVTIVKVEPLSPASRAGLRPGDVVVGFSGSGLARQVSDVHRASELISLVQSASAGDHALVIIERSGAKRAVRATLELMPRRLFCDPPRR